MPEWETESLRLTCFLASSAMPSEPTWWSDLTGNVPESRTSRPRSGELTESGPCEGKSLTMVIVPGRIDWHLTTIQQGRPEAGLTAIGLYDDVMRDFVALMSRWLPMSPDLQRLAVGTVLSRIVKDRTDGYQQLQPYLHAVKLDPESTDFMYQINRPRRSSIDVPDLKINRLSKWSVMALASVALSIERDVFQQRVTPTTIACRLELDINTQPDFVGPLPKDKLDPIFHELTHLASEIANAGDIL
jgi:hypothetical protein